MSAARAFLSKRSPILARNVYTGCKPLLKPSSTFRLPSSSSNTLSKATSIGAAVASGALTYVILDKSFQPILLEEANPGDFEDHMPYLIQRFPSPPDPVYDDTSLPMRERMAAWVKSLQTRLCQHLEEIENAPGAVTDVSTATSSLVPFSSASSSRTPQTFIKDSWLRKQGGEGVSCVLQDGRVFEKAGVNVSIVHGTLPPKAVESMRADHGDSFQGWYDGKTNLQFFACGISSVVHPRNPHAPTTHFNYRYFEVEDPAKPGTPAAWWFGGGADLTPAYLYPEDGQTFHQTYKAACDAHDAAYYPRFKAWCDKYFYIPHRQETRGIGGIFFDDLGKASGSQEQLFNFVRECGEAFPSAYGPIMRRRLATPFTEHQKRWQALRRGRYVEFNLVYDRGTQFGLRTPGARIESILMSLPLAASWEYQPEIGTEEGTPEADLMDAVRQARDWTK